MFIIVYYIFHFPLYIKSTYHMVGYPEHKKVYIGFSPQHIPSIAYSHHKKYPRNIPLYPQSFIIVLGQVQWDHSKSIEIHELPLNHDVYWLEEIPIIPPLNHSVRWLTPMKLTIYVG